MTQPPSFEPAKKAARPDSSGAKEVVSGRSGGTGAFGQAVCPGTGIGFERHGYVGARAARSEKGGGSLGKAARLGQQSFIFDRRAFLGGKHLVDGGRAAVGHGVAENGVAGSRHGVRQGIESAEL